MSIEINSGRQVSIGERTYRATWNGWKTTPQLKYKQVPSGAIKFKFAF